MRTTLPRTPLAALAAAVLTLALAPAPLVAQDAPEEVRRPRQSWTADRRAFAEGDVLTVLIDDYSLARQHTGNSALSSRSRDADLAVTQTVVRRPGVPTAAGASYGSGTRGESRQRGDALRENSFRGEISVRVVGVEPNGLLRVEGSKRVNVDNSAQEISLSGYVRPQDVTAGNTVESWRVAELELRNTSRGSLARPRGGIVSRLVGWLWP